MTFPAFNISLYNTIQLTGFDSIKKICIQATMSHPTPKTAAPESSQTTPYV